MVLFPGVDPDGWVELGVKKDSEVHSRLVGKRAMIGDFLGWGTLKGSHKAYGRGSKTCRLSGGKARFSHGIAQLLNSGK